MDKRLIAYATDVHGKTRFIEKMLEASGKHRVKAVVLNGDLTPDEYFLDVIAQRDFFESFLVPVFRKFRKKNDIEIFLIMGNHDFKENMDVFYRAEKEGVLKVLHDRIFKIDGYFITGYSFINPAGTFNWEKPESEIKKDLGKLKGRLDFSRAVFVSHAPPYNTKLDMRHGGRHVGSKSIREFIEKCQPRLGLHGHIHESPKVSGAIQDRIGRTLCINPGNERLVLIDLDSLDIKKV